VDVDAPPGAGGAGRSGGWILDLPAAAVLMRIRAMGVGALRGATARTEADPEAVRDARLGFLPLDADPPGKYVGGMVGRPWAQGPARPA